MAGKKENDPKVEVRNKTLEELTDSEFLFGAERLSEPFYFDYFSAPPGRHIPLDGYVSDTQLGILAKNAQATVTSQKVIVEETKKEEEGSQTKKKNRYKRIAILVIILVLSLILLVGSVLGLAVEAVAEYVSLFKGNDSAISMMPLEPILGLVAKLTDGEAPEGYTYYQTIKNEYEAIPVYAVSCAEILFLVCILIIFIKSLVALFENECKSGSLKRRKFAYTAMVAFLCALIVLVGGLYLLGSDIMGIVSFVKPENVPYTFGYVLYAMAGGTLLIAILSAFAYRKEKKENE